MHFYKLNKSKRYGVEGTYFNIGEAILLGVVLTFFWTVVIAQIVVNFKVLFHDVRITVFIFVFVVILSVITALACARYSPIIKRRKHARKILKNCTLTDGTVLDVQKQEALHHGTHRTFSYYRVYIKYSFYGLDGVLRYGEHRWNYGEVPFIVGQNLMIAFNDTENIILSKFTLSDGAEEFAKAEAEREQVDFSGLTGNLIKVDVSKPIFIADYGWSLIINDRRRKRLEKILQDYPRFTVGKYFIKRSTYRYKAGNKKFYCFIEENGNKRVEECAGICDLNDGNEVMVAYGGGVSEIISHYTVKKSVRKPRRKKSD